MPKLKHLLIGIIAFVLLFLCACGAVSTTKNTTTVSAAIAASPAPTPAPKATATPRPTSTPVPVFDVNSVRMQSTPDSSCFSSVGYDADFEKLVVVFRETGAKYVYSDFSSSDWADFKSASSLGKWYNSNIKGYYPCEKVS